MAKELIVIFEVIREKGYPFYELHAHTAYDDFVKVSTNFNVKAPTIHEAINNLRADVNTYEKSDPGANYRITLAGNINSNSSGRVTLYFTLEKPDRALEGLASIRQSDPDMIPKHFVDQLLQNTEARMQLRFDRFTFEQRIKQLEQENKELLEELEEMESEVHNRSNMIQQGIGGLGNQLLENLNLGALLTGQANNPTGLGGVQMDETTKQIVELIQMAQLSEKQKTQLYYGIKNTLASLAQREAASDSPHAANERRTGRNGSDRRTATPDGNEQRSQSAEALEGNEQESTPY